MVYRDGAQEALLQFRTYRGTWHDSKPHSMYDQILVNSQRIRFSGHFDLHVGHSASMLDEDSKSVLPAWQDQGIRAKVLDSDRFVRLKSSGWWTAHPERLRKEWVRIETR